MGMIKTYHGYFRMFGDVPERKAGADIALLVYHVSGLSM